MSQHQCAEGHAWDNGDAVCNRCGGEDIFATKPEPIEVKTKAESAAETATDPTAEQLAEFAVGERVLVESAWEDEDENFHDEFATIEKINANGTVELTFEADDADVMATLKATAFELGALSKISPEAASTDDTTATAPTETTEAVAAPVEVTAAAQDGVAAPEQAATTPAEPAPAADASAA